MCRGQGPIGVARIGLAAGGACAAGGLRPKNGSGWGAGLAPHGQAPRLYPLSPHPAGMRAGACGIGGSRFDVSLGMACTTGKNDRVGGGWLGPHAKSRHLYPLSSISLHSLHPLRSHDAMHLPLSSTCVLGTHSAVAVSVAVWCTTDCSTRLPEAALPFYHLTQANIADTLCPLYNMVRHDGAVGGGCLIGCA